MRNSNVLHGYHSFIHFWLGKYLYLIIAYSEIFHTFYAEDD